MSTILIFIVVIALLIFVHEFGHFVSAKRAGMKVEEFGFGFPPRIAGIERGGTLYSLNWIPLGGFVRIKGEDGADATHPDSFAGRPRWQRAIVLVAGVAMNFFLAWVLLTIGYIVGTPQITEELSPLARVTDEKAQVMSVLEGSPAAEAGIVAGDIVRTMGGAPVEDVGLFRERTSHASGERLLLGVEHEGVLREVAVVPRELAEIGRPGIGVALVSTGLVSYPAWWAPVEGLYATGGFAGQILGAFGGLIRDLVATREVSVEFSGPVGIAVVTAKVAALGFRHLLQFTALLSINLAILNILPLPALDGGRLLFLGIEAVRQRPVDRRLEAIVHNIGFSLLLFLLVVITYRDIVRFGDSIRAAAMGAFGG